MTLPRPSSPVPSRLVATPGTTRARDGARPDGLATTRARDLATALRDSDPMRASFDVAVRRFVRAERDAGRDLDTILASVAAVLREHVEPELPAERRHALQHAIAWFTVSEYHRAD